MQAFKIQILRLRSSIENGNNTETPENRRNVHVLVVSLAGGPNHHL